MGDQNLRREINTTLRNLDILTTKHIYQAVYVSIIATLGNDWNTGAKANITNLYLNHSLLVINPAENKRELL